jgi:hypothetical protein
MVRRYGLRDAQWEQIEARLPGRAGTVGGDGEGHPIVCRSGVGPASRGDPVGGSSGAVRRFPSDPHAPRRAGVDAASGSGCLCVSSRSSTTNMR